MDDFGDNGLQLLIVMGATESFREPPTQDDCQALQATQKGRVLFDPDTVMSDTYGMQINGGGALVDQGGLWLTDPVNGSPWDELYGMFW